MTAKWKCYSTDSTQGNTTFEERKKRIIELLENVGTRSNLFDYLTNQGLYDVRLGVMSVFAVNILGPRVQGIHGRGRSSKVIYDNSTR